MKLTDVHIKSIVALCKKYKVNRLFVFGSILTDRFNDSSDIDLVVDFKKDEIDDYFDNYFDFKYSLQDICLKRAVERDIEIIGEAMNRILKEDRNIAITNSRKIVDARNYIIHGYDSLSADILWSIVINHLPKLKEEVQVLLKQ